MILSAVLCLCAQTPSLWAQSPKGIIDEVVWMVGDEPLLRSDIENQKMLLRSEGRILSAQEDCVLAEQMAVQLLLLNQAKIDSISVDESLITRYVENMLQETISQIGSKEKLEEYFGKSLSQIREEQKRLAKSSEIARSMRSQIVKEVQVTPSDIRAFFASQKTDSLPYIPATVEVQLLKLQPEVSLLEIDRIKAQLMEWATQINEGKKDFSSLARLYSQDQRTAFQGGEYGFVGRGSLEQEFAAIVFNLTSPSKVSPIIKSEQGYHIVQLIEKRGDVVNFRHILLRPQVSSEELEKNVSKLDSLLVEIKSGKLPFAQAVEIYATEESSKNNAGLLINDDYRSSRQGSSFFTLEELPQEISKQVDRLKPGDLSNSFIITGTNGLPQVVAVLLKSYTPGHRANLVDDFQIIKSMALEDKQQKVLDDWINEHLKDTYFYIAPELRSCAFKYQGWNK